MTAIALPGFSWRSILRRAAQRQRALMQMYGAGQGAVRDASAQNPAVYRGGLRAAGAANGLLSNLVAYWPGNEASGNAQDAHTNALHLTATLAPLSATGLVYSLARQYTGFTGQRHVRPGDDALLSTGDVDYTLAAWVKLASYGAGTFHIAGKDNELAGGREYKMLYTTSLERLRFAVLDGTGVVGVQAANSLGKPALSTWYLVIGWHDSVANTVNIQVNNGTVDSVAAVGVPGDTATPFSIGAASVGASPMDGLIGPTMFWKSVAGGGGVLTSAQRAALYNGGAGLQYASFT